MVEAVKRGFPQREIADAAYDAPAASTTRGERIVVGVNDYTEGDDGELEILRIDPALERKQIDRVQAVRARRDAAAVEARAGRAARAGRRRDANLMPNLLDARACTPPRARSSRRSRTSWAPTRRRPVF